MYIKIYFLVLLALVVLGLFETVRLTIATKEVGLLDIINYMLTIFLFVGVAGGIWKKRILNKLTWKVFFAGEIIWSVVFLYITQKAVVVDGVVIPWSPWLMVSVVLIFPLVILLYLYAFKSPQIWEKENINDTKLSI